MAIKELPKNEQSKFYEECGLDVRPIKVTGWDWFRLNVLSKFDKCYSLNSIDDANPKTKSEQSFSCNRHV